MLNRINKQRRAFLKRMSEENKYLVSIYGSLRKGGVSHHLLARENFLGSFDTEPIYDMYVFGLYPVLIKDGNTSIKMEVYEVSEPVFKKLQFIRQHNDDTQETEPFDKTIIYTPYGNATTFFSSLKISNKVKVASGDWLDYRKQILREIKQNK